MYKKTKVAQAKHRAKVKKFQEKAKAQKQAGAAPARNQ